jgi:hypothetical protein
MSDDSDQSKDSIVTDDPFLTHYSRLWNKGPVKPFQLRKPTVESASPKSNSLAASRFMGRANRIDHVIAML